MSWVRIAVATTDGSVIDQALQEASSFAIYDIAPEGPQLVELRSPARVDSAGKSSEPTVDEVIDLISDCSILVVRSLGFEAGGKMQVGWITVYEADMQVEKALKKFSRSPLIRNALG